MQALKCTLFTDNCIGMFGDNQSYAFFVRNYGCALFYYGREGSMEGYTDEMKNNIDSISEATVYALEKAISKSFNDVSYELYFKFKEIVGGLDDPKVKQNFEDLEFDYLEYRKRRDLFAYQMGASVASSILTKDNYR